MFTTYYDLRDESKLPPGSYFSDPTDSSEYRPDVSESLDDFIKRVESSRAEKELLSIPEGSLRRLIVESLLHTTTPNRQDRFFIQRSALPTTSQIISLSKAIISQRIRGRQADYTIRQSRANSCAGCPLHDKRSSVSWALGKIITTAASLENIHQSDLEKNLGRCRACGCGLVNKVRFDILATLSSLNAQNILGILQTLRESGFSKCWMLRESMQHATTKQLLTNKLVALPAPYKDMMKSYETLQVQKGKNGQPQS